MYLKKKKNFQSEVRAIVEIVPIWEQNLALDLSLTCYMTLGKA